MEEDILKIEKQVWVRCKSNRNYSVDRHKGKEGKPDYYVLTEHNKSGNRFRIVILQPDLQRVIKALQDASQP